jgi:hypothetical protein
VVENSARYLARVIKLSLKFSVFGQLLVELHVGGAD